MYSTDLPACKQILQKLVSYDVLGGTSNLTIMDAIIEILIDNKIEFHLVPNEDMTKTSLHCRIGPDAPGGVILSGHTDVVPVAGQDWHTEPFSVVELGGKLFGRGTCDMKGFLACCLASIAMFQSANLRKPVYFAFSYDEEVGCLAGPALAEAIAGYYSNKPSFAIIGEPSMMKPVIGQKGICVLETKVLGSAGHSSRIRQEVSAVHVAARLIGWLEQKMDDLIREGRLDDRFHPPHTSLHVGMISGGIAPNVIADSCTFYWDVRVIPGDDVQQIIAEFEQYCNEVKVELQKKFAGAEIQTRMDHPPVPPLGTENDADVVHLIRKITDCQDLGTVAYAAEAGQFSQAGFQSVICGPGDIAQAHRANEFVAESQLQECLDMLVKLAQVLSESE